MRHLIEQVLQFWFGDISQELADKAKQNLWYAASVEQDLQIAAQFGSLVESAATGQFKDWQHSPRGSLALIILLDQMPRNIYRETAAAFANDALALQYCLDGIDRGHDQRLCLIERCFYYHPLEHSESLSMQDLCLSKFNELEDEYFLEPHIQFIQNAQGFAREHADIIERFGRFPHRNRVLNRKSSQQELAYLKTAKRFGQ
ncbi:DUF924 family protein [Thalassotalea mangrovi]|uniref:DUF924 domain-containing protein n=1 Tax=Thalassotalea mangrovi TaxID=2572245 RepID=A0A4U1B678_9GAMM|nr:DUF924 family protein [Thalassotalea mangrovi]TKB46031.1 DUF924 domain-containing protein [Thalassotalea mangrovi]